MNERSGSRLDGTEGESAMHQSTGHAIEEAREQRTSHAHAFGDNAAQAGKTLAEGVEELGAAVRGRVETIASTAAGTAQIAAEAGSHVAGGVRHLAGQASAGAQTTSAQIQENPIGFAAGIGALGLLLGLLLPSTRLEREKLAPLGDKVAEHFGPRDLLAHAKAMFFDSASNGSRPPGRRA